MEKNNTLLNPLLRWMAEGPIEWKRWNTPVSLTGLFASASSAAQAAGATR